MKALTIYSLLAILLTTACFTSCIKPRVELNEGAWGDQAYITSVVLFRYDSVTNQLGYDQPVTGYQNVAVTTTTNLIDRPTATMTIVASRGTMLNRIGVRFSHFAQKIEPLNGAPPAGVISDFSKGPYIYKVISSDGTTRDWKLDISVAP